MTETNETNPWLGADFDTAIACLEERKYRARTTDANYRRAVIGITETLRQRADRLESDLNVDFVPNETMYGHPQRSPYVDHAQQVVRFIQSTVAQLNLDGVIEQAVLADTARRLSTETTDKPLQRRSISDR